MLLFCSYFLPIFGVCIALFFSITPILVMVKWIGRLFV